MLLSEVKDYLKTVIDCPQWYTGKIDGTVEQCIGIYSTNGPSSNIALGGLANTSYSTKAISILVHWGKNSNTAEQKAQEVYNALFGQSASIGGKKVTKFNMRSSEPVGVGTDANGIFEYVMEVIIYFER
ncbi:minor capsid protein [Clostridium saccharoperbutylacetonicum]|uniref:phage tail terminator protein n=1 Tax=Clostridium saccharoperbutylacetonicum TaxID=36745 RepID=UPI0039EAB220